MLFNLQHPSALTKYICGPGGNIHRFEQFHVAYGLSKKIDEKQANTLLYCLGEDILSTTNVSTKHLKKWPPKGLQEV